MNKFIIITLILIVFAYPVFIGVIMLWDTIKNILGV
jgi:hypothetical protein